MTTERKNFAKEKTNDFSARHDATQLRFFVIETKSFGKSHSKQIAIPIQFNYLIYSISHITTDRRFRCVCTDQQSKALTENGEH